MLENKVLKRILTIAVLIIAFLAYQDITGFHLFGLVGGFGSETYMKVEPLYLQQFWLFSYGIILMMAIVYYVLVKDKSEAFAIFAIPFILLLSGAEDVLYFLFLRIPLPPSMPWLFTSYNGYSIMGFVAKVMGFATVTPLSLIVSLIVGIILSTIVYIVLIAID